MLILLNEKVIKDEETGEIIELHCTYDPETRVVLIPVERSKGTCIGYQQAMQYQRKFRLYDYLLLEDGKKVN